MRKSNITYTLIVFFFLFLSSTVIAQSQKLPSVFLEELTWTEVQEALDRGTTTIIIPTGGTEQSGPFIALGKHNVRVKYMAEKIALELGDALVAPTMAYVPEGGIDPPKSHMRWAGTIHLPHEYFVKVIEYASRSFNQHGFTDIVLIGDSGQNQKGMKEVSEELNKEWKDSETRVHFISEFYSDSKTKELLIDEGMTEETLGSHAGVLDVAYLLVVDPKMIRQDVIAELGNDPEENRKLGFIGDPSKATLEIGRRRIDRKISVSLDQIAKLKKENRE